MKKCPNCQKEFPDAMRFCQTDGTPLVDAPSEDFLKTTVVRPEELADVIPPADPYKTVVGGGLAPDDSGDLLQIPDDVDPLQTVVSAPVVVAPVEPEPPSFVPPTPPEPPVFEAPHPEPPRFEDIRNEIKPEKPSSPFDAFSAPPEPPVVVPEPPPIIEPSLNPPSFGDMSGAVAHDEEMAPTMIQSNWNDAPSPVDSPFGRPEEPPVPSPFAPPSSPFDQPAPSAPAYQEPPPVQFGQQFDQMNQGFGGDQQLSQQAEWMPPAPPEQGWQDQGLGANTPFQPPVVGAQGENKTLAIVSLVLGILGLCCGIAGIGALITGFIAKNNCDKDPATYGGRGLAIGGMVLGGISVFLMIIGIVLNLLGMLAR